MNRLSGSLLSIFPWDTRMFFLLFGAWWGWIHPHPPLLCSNTCEYVSLWHLSECSIKSVLFAYYDRRYVMMFHSVKCVWRNFLTLWSAWFVLAHESRFKGHWLCLDGPSGAIKSEFYDFWQCHWFSPRTFTYKALSVLLSPRHLKDEKRNLAKCHPALIKINFYIWMASPQLSLSGLT